MPISLSMSLLVFSDPGTILLFTVGRQVFGFCLTLVLWRYYLRWPATNFQIVRHALKVVLACALASLVDGVLTQLCVQAFHLPALPPVAERGAWFARFAMYVAWSALYFAIRWEIESRNTELRLARAEAENREAELQRLRAQINPHFLFNALGSIIAEAETNPPAVAPLTHAMADYLRYSLTHGMHQAPLGEELTAMASYLQVESASFGPGRLDWKIQAADDVRLAVVPTALVQPLIENALKYGRQTSPRPLRLRVSARVEGPEVVVAVENSGTWVARAPGEKSATSTGIGLGNVRRRLELLCGPAARLETATPDGHVRVEVRLPHLPPKA
jgi:LytS/YehU family sensor histidine kinase